MMIGLSKMESCSFLEAMAALDSGEMVWNNHCKSSEFYKKDHDGKIKKFLMEDDFIPRQVTGAVFYVHGQETWMCEEC